MSGRVPGLIYANDVGDAIWQKHHPVGKSKEVEILERRLDDGWKRIDQAIQRGQDARNWEDFWIDLLHQYESVAPHG